MSARRITTARALAFRASGVTSVQYRGNEPPAHEVWINGNLVAECTDKWMADLVFAECMKGREIVRSFKADDGWRDRCKLVTK